MNNHNGNYGASDTFLKLAVIALVMLAALACNNAADEPTATPSAAPAFTDGNNTPRAESTELFEAVWRGQADRVQTLVDAGADVNQRDPERNPVLLQAVWRNHAEIVEILAEAGADVNATDADGNPLLREAIWRGHTDIMQILVDVGADVNAQGADGNPLLREAIWRGHTEIVQILVDEGADVNARDAEDDPLLREAISGGRTEIVQILVDAGADVNARDAEDDPLLQEARWRGHTEIEQILLRPRALRSRWPGYHEALLVSFLRIRGSERLNNGQPKRRTRSARRARETGSQCAASAGDCGLWRRYWRFGAHPDTALPACSRPCPPPSPQLKATGSPPSS